MPDQNMEDQAKSYMDSLYVRSQEIIAHSIIAGVSLDRLIVAFATITDIVQHSEEIPSALRPELLLRCLAILRNIEAEKERLDLVFAEFTPHPDCSNHIHLTLGELWELPSAIEWFCYECGKPLYSIHKG